MTVRTRILNIISHNDDIVIISHNDDIVAGSNAFGKTI